MTIEEAISFMNCERKVSNINCTLGIPLYMSSNGIIHDDNNFQDMTQDEFLETYKDFQTGWYISC